MAAVTMQTLSPFTDSSTIVNQPQALRERANHDGYLFFKGLLPKQALSTVRDDVLNTMVDHGVIDHYDLSKTAIPGANHDVCKDHSQPRYKALYKTLLSLRSVHALAIHSDLLTPLRHILGDNLLPHSRNIIRTIAPGSAKYSTPPHQDFWYIGGTENTWTSWIPAGNISQDMGGLAIAPGTHKQGIREREAAYGAGGHTIKDLDDTTAWASQDFEMGDVLLLHSLCVHQGQDNLTSNYRISLDFRYQNAKAPIDPSSLRPHLGYATWEEIYKTWPEPDALKYYWKSIVPDLPL